MGKDFLQMLHLVHFATYMVLAVEKTLDCELGRLVFLGLMSLVLMSAIAQYSKSETPGRNYHSTQVALVSTTTQIESVLLRNSC